MLSLVISAFSFVVSYILSQILKKKQIFIAAIITALLSCKLDTENEEYVVIRNQTDKSLEVNFTDSNYNLILQPYKEIEVAVFDSISFITLFGLVYAEQIFEPTTIELHEDGFYIGEQFKPYSQS